MLSNDELLRLVKDTNKRDAWRKEALDKLIQNLAVSHLYKIVLDTNRSDSWRKRALDAICEIATFINYSSSSSISTLTIGGNSISIQSSSIHLSIPSLASEASDVLYKMVNDTNRSDSWRYQCLRYLIKIKHKDYLQKIANNTNRSDKWRNEAMQTLIHG